MPFEALKTFRRWLCWQITQDGDRFLKIPVNPSTGLPAACDDPQTWVDYETAQAAVAAGKYASIGFALGKEVGLVIVDFDKVRPDPSHPWPKWVRSEVEDLDSYTEVSASGMGLHVLVWGGIPSNMNRQKCHSEIWDSNKMFALSGNVYEGRDTIQKRDVHEIHRRIQDGRIGPDHKPGIIVERYDTAKYDAIVGGKWEEYGMGRSEAVQSALCSLAVKHNFDREAMRADFETTVLCAAWEETGKWTRRADQELDVAIEFMGKQKPPASVQVLEFAKAPVPGGDYDFVVNIDGKDGWFPRGEISLVAASSGTGKTTLMTDILMKQLRGEEVFGHETNRLPYLFLLEDRSDRALRRTLNRMGIRPDELPFRKLNRDGLTVAQAVADALDRTEPTPAAIFLEGIDLAADDANKMQNVSKFLKDIQRVAEHYHAAIIGSTGCPKVKPKDRYTSLRDMVIGSSAWARKVETIIALQKEGGKETDEITIMTVLPRNAKPEEFRLKFENGRLVDAGPAPEGDEPVDRASHTALTNWAMKQDTFTVDTAWQAFNFVSRDTIERRLRQLWAQGTLTYETRKRQRVYAYKGFEVPQ